MLRDVPWWVLAVGLWLLIDVVFVVGWVIGAEATRRRAERACRRRRQARGGYPFGDGLAGEFPRGEA